MSTRSLRVHSDWIETVRSAYQSRYVRQKDLAEDAEISSVDTVNRFLNGKPVSRENFWRLCGLLELSWEIVTNSIFVSETTKLPNAGANQDTHLLQGQKQVESKLASTTLENPNFIGREQEIGYLRHLNKQGYTCILLLAPGGVGKTTLARCFLKREFSTYIEFSIAKEEKYIASAASLVEEKLRQLNEDPGREFYISLERLRHKLQTQKIGVLVDNLEPALDGQGRFINKHRDYLDLLRILSDSSLQSLTIITSREPLYENLDIHLLLLRSLSLEDWKSYFLYHQVITGIPVLKEIHKAYDGNALAMKVLVNLIKQHYKSDILDYWQHSKIGRDVLVEQAVKNLIQEQFERLKIINLDAYNLLCRMGCYRFQDVLTVPLEGLLCLLWDVSEPKYQVVYLLSRCSLIEYKDNEYYLHPIIRAEAISRLKNSTSWENANRKAAEFWNEATEKIDNIEDALVAFEAYYHYLNILDYESAGRVISQPRGEGEDPFMSDCLGTSFYVLGLLEKVCIAIAQVKNFVKDSFCLVRLYLVLGYAYNLSGYIHKGIECHQRSRQIVVEYLNTLPNTDSDSKFRKKLEHMYICSYINIALCKIDLWELQDAQENLEQFLNLGRNSGFLDTVICAYCSLAFLHSYNQNYDLAQSFIKKAETEMNLARNSPTWDRAYNPLFLGFAYKNLAQFDKAIEMYEKAIAVADTIHYTQASAKAYSGLAELYREIRNFETALENHSKSISMLEEIGAKCDLAEAYFQFGLTHQLMGEIAKGWEYRDKAIQLFAEVQAPKQVERVRQNFNRVEL